MEKVLKNESLSATEHLKIMIFLPLLIPSVFPALLGIIPVLFLAFGYYMMKKNRDFSSLEVSVKSATVYYKILIVLSVLVLVFGLFSYLNYDSESFVLDDYDGPVFDRNYDGSGFDKNDATALVVASREENSLANTEFARDIRIAPYGILVSKYGEEVANSRRLYTQARDEQFRISQRERGRNNDYSAVFIIASLTALIAFAYILALKHLYFIPLQNHSEWVVANGTFSNKPKNPVSDNLKASVDIIKSEKLKPHSVADELLKWAKLKEDGLISDEEFNEARSKLLNRS